MKPANIREKGQAIVAVTLGLFAICGMVGLAVDLGWSFYLRRTMQAAADAAALAGARDALLRVSGSPSLVCGSSLACSPAPVACASPVGTPNTSLDVACAYSSKNGFVNTDPQQVSVQSDVPSSLCRAGAPATPPSCIPAAPGVNAYYWITVRIQERVPQLFSRFFGQTDGLVAASATAAITDSTVIGSLILLNRENDGGTGNGPDEVPAGMNLIGQGGPDVNVPGGIIMASQCTGANCNDRYAGELQGNGDVAAPFTFIRGTGSSCAGNIPGCGGGWGQSTWTALPQNGSGGGIPSDSSIFDDPLSGLGQPPLTASALNVIPVANGVINGGNQNNPTVLQPGNYISTTNGVADGNPIRLGSGYFRFGECSANYFGDFHFFGGLATMGGNSNVQFGSGRYVLAGIRGGGELFNVDNGTILRDCGPAGQPNPSDLAGEVFIFTKPSYPGLNAQFAGLEGFGMNSILRDQLEFGSSGFKMGNNENSQISLHGLNRSNSEVQSRSLEPFAPVVLWQDQQNSRVQYTTAGNVDISCGSLDEPCMTGFSASEAQQMFLKANADLQLYGAAYQPRGATLVMGGGSDDMGPLMVITGGLRVQAGANITLQGPADTLVTRTAALVR